MNDTTDEGTGTGGTTPLVLEPATVTAAAKTAGSVAEKLGKTPKLIAGPTETATSSLKGWTASMETLSKVAKQWVDKTAALVYGPDGMTDFSESLSQFVTAATAQDQSNAGHLATNAGVEREFGGEYVPQEASEDYVDQLMNGK